MNPCTCLANTEVHVLGSTPESDDIWKFQSVGMSNHTIIPGLEAISGRQLYVSVKGTLHVKMVNSERINNVVCTISANSRLSYIIHCLHLMLYPPI